MNLFCPKVRLLSDLIILMIGDKIKYLKSDFISPNKKISLLLLKIDPYRGSGPRRTQGGGHPALPIMAQKF